MSTKHHCFDYYRERTFRKEGTKDMGSCWCDKVVKLLDKFEEGRNGGPRFHDRPTAFWGVSVKGSQDNGNVHTILRQPIHDTQHGD